MNSKKPTGLFFDSLKHFKVNLSTLLEHFLSIDFSNKKSIEKYLLEIPNNAKAKFPDMKKIRLIDYTSQKQAQLTSLGKYIQQSGTDDKKLGIGLLLLNYNFENNDTPFRPYWQLLNILKQYDTLTDELLLDILSTNKNEINNGTIKYHVFNSLSVADQEEIKRPKSYIINFLITIDVLIKKEKYYLVNKKQIDKLFAFSNKYIIDDNIIEEEVIKKGKKNRNVTEQSLFRDSIILAYNKKCFITETSVIRKDTNQIYLQAAHIVPYHKGGSFAINNGILLRYDMHKYFDDGLITIVQNENKYVVKCSTKLDTNYLMRYDNIELKNIPPENYRPSPIALKWHYDNVFLK